ncbi:MAG: sigma-70 family RNA polymerase sigma factor [Acidobacteriota bacterium]
MRSTELDHLHAAYRYALALVGDRAEAEDLAQQGWLRLFERYGGVPARAALYTTVRRIFVDRWRRERRVELLALEEVDDPPADPPLSAVDRVDLERALGCLRPFEREVLYLHAVEGWTAAEIAEWTERPRGTVLSLLFRARRKLAAEVEATGSPAAEGGA